jgi:hypothetical protein
VSFIIPPLEVPWMSKRRENQRYLPIETLGDLARPNPDTPVIPLAPPAICSRCDALLEMSWEFHARGLWWAYAKCPACSTFFVRRSPTRTPEEWGWQIEPDPPEFVRDPNWLSQLKQASAGGEAETDQGATVDRPRE